MQAPQTDMIANYLNVTLFLFTVAFLAFFEALKFEGRRAIVAWAIFGLFVLSGLLTLVPSVWPTGVAALQWFGSIASSPFTWAVLVLLFYLAWREKYRPKGSPAALDRDPDSIPDFGHLAVLEHRIEALEKAEPSNQQISGELHAIRAKQAAIIKDYQRMLALEAHVEEDKTYVHGQLAALNAHRSLDSDTIADRFSQIQNSLVAIWHRERLRYLQQELDDAAAELSVPTTLEAHLDEDQWVAWAAKQGEWLSVLSQWCELAARYVPTIREQVLTVPDEHYKRKGEAKLAQFPDAEAYTTYKAFSGNSKKLARGSTRGVRSCPRGRV